ncbi:putative zinc-binding oxidoreductase ToxD [Mytilinidion resinicola]|uniref:Zinc-binding oxidoreductase ToxD n=1 Tax=Mytilinidion resinicola TaxID=574789 RepID=A0A6A6Z277_9PEZI|nr:putative zinc-binding oxidoreductase ToxD [Mytilinidion resinicola]KAF2814773.1 putative zinc-binding oxidoreductase ToxD [Mytilinidion resinicola]
MHALKIQSPTHAAVVTTPLPPLPPGHLLIRTHAVALNPTDWNQHIDAPALGLGPVGSTIGCDYAGVITAVGAGVDASQIGVRVCGVVHGANTTAPTSGAFAEYVVAPAGLVIKLPEQMSWEEGAGLGVAMLTVGQAFYQKKRLPVQGLGGKEGEVGAGEGGKKPWFLVYGGSSGMGAYGIQFAKLSGFEVITTCHPRNFDYVKSLGASAAFDYRAPGCGAEIRAYTDNQLYDIWDTIGGDEVAKICAEAFSDSAKPDGSKLWYGSITGDTFSPRDDVEVSFNLGYTGLGREFEIAGEMFEASEEDFEFMKMWCKVAEGLIAEGKIKIHRMDVRDGGLEGVFRGILEMKEGKVSGKKLIYKLEL